MHGGSIQVEFMFFPNNLKYNHLSSMLVQQNFCLMCLIIQILFLFSHMWILVHSFMYFLPCVRAMGQRDLNILHFSVICYISIRFLATLDNSNCNSFQDCTKFSFVYTNSVEKLNRLFIGYYWRKYSHETNFDLNILVE